MRNKRKKYLIYLLSILVILNATTAFAGKPVTNKPPIAVASADPPTSGPLPLTVQFRGSGSYDPDGTIVSHYWDFGNGGTSTLADPLYTYQNMGTFSAVLTVTDDKGAIDASSTITISVEAQIPKIMRFQGTLKDASGALINGIVTAIYSIYDVETGGSPLWSEQQTLNIQDGILDVELGYVTPIDLSFDKQYWLGVQINPDTTEMSPRFKLTTMPYAFRAKH